MLWINMMIWIKIQIWDEDFEDDFFASEFFGDWGLTHGISIISILAALAFSAWRMAGGSGGKESLKDFLNRIDGLEWFFSHPQRVLIRNEGKHSFFDTEFHTEADDVSPDSQDGTLCLGDLNHFCQVKTCLRCKDHFSVRNMLHICRRMKIEMEVWSPVPTEMFASFYLDATGHWGSPLECLWQLDISKSRVQRGRSMEVMWEEMRFEVVFCLSDGRFSLCKPCLVKINFTEVYFQFPISAFHVTTITMMCVCAFVLIVLTVTKEDRQAKRYTIQVFLLAVAIASFCIVHFIAMLGNHTHLAWCTMVYLFDNEPPQPPA